MRTNKYWILFLALLGLFTCQDSREALVVSEDGEIFVGRRENINIIDEEREISYYRSRDSMEIDIDQDEIVDIRIIGRHFNSVSGSFFTNVTLKPLNPALKLRAYTYPDTLITYATKTCEYLIRSKRKIDLNEVDTIFAQEPVSYIIPQKLRYGTRHFKGSASSQAEIYTIRLNSTSPFNSFTNCLSRAYSSGDWTYNSPEGYLVFELPQTDQTFLGYIRLIVADSWVVVPEIGFVVLRE